MKVITKYVLKEVIKIFLLCQLIFNLLFLVIDFIGKIDKFIEAEVPLTLTLSFFLYKIPFITAMMIPVATMISIITVISLMKKNMEIMAMKACGLNLLKVFQPVIFFSLILSLISFFLSEVIVPYTSTRSNEIMAVEVKKQSQASFQEWYKSKNNYYWIKHFDIETQTINNPTFYFFDDQFHLTKKIYGETCKWEDGEWKLENVIIQTRDDDYKPRIKSGITLKIPETPDTFIKKMKKPEDMRYFQLKKHAEKVKAEGYDNTTDLVELNLKLAFPFISAVLSLIAISIGLWEKINGIPLAITIGIGSLFSLFLVMGSAKTLGFAGTLPPFLSAWTANILFILLGCNLLMNVKK